jgi:hypothetical protein
MNVKSSLLYYNRKQLGNKVDGGFLGCRPPPPTITTEISWEIKWMGGFWDADPPPPTYNTPPA